MQLRRELKLLLPSRLIWLQTHSNLIFKLYFAMRQVCLSNPLPGSTVLRLVDWAKILAVDLAPDARQVVAAFLVLNCRHATVFRSTVFQSTECLLRES